MAATGAPFTMATVNSSSTDPARPAVLFVEDEASIYEPFSAALVRAGFDPTVVRTAGEAIESAERLRPSLVLLDLNLPDGDGLDVCRELQRRSDVPILMLTARGTETDKIIGLGLGADDYVVKPFSGDEVIARIRAILRRSERNGKPAGPSHIGELKIDPAARRAVLRGKELSLTRKEFDLLERLVRDAGRVVTREDLMSEIWDTNWFGSTKTLDVHIGWLRKKLGDDPVAPRYIHTVRGVGFRFATDEEVAP
jgi:two-component system response regulator RegX3